MLEVAVIGAGAAGLVASRHLLAQGLRPSIFEAAKSLGGAWNTTSSSGSGGNGKMWNGMHTNLSKYTCRFSEWPWPESTPTFPSATDMHHYLESYAEHFVDPSCFQYQCQVTNIEKCLEGDGIYRVEWMDLNSQTKHSKDFEGVVVATGFFHKAHFPEGLLLGLEDDDNNEDDRRRNMIMHSSDYVDPADFANESVAVIGASFSALEIAVDISQSADRVVSVLPSIPWVLPRYIPNANGSILPVDLAFYPRAQDAPQLPETTVMTPEGAQARHSFLQSILGHRQKESPLGIPLDWDKPPMVAISDYYLDLVMDEQIDVLKGRLTGMDATGLQIQSPEGQWVLPNITKVICCTGYESNLEAFVDQESILDAIEYDSKDTFCPMTLCWDTLHPNLPNLAFCGMYRGPYMGIMELQGRLAAGVLSGNIELEDGQLEQALQVSRQIRDQQPRPQFPHFDYVGFLDTLTQTIDVDFPKYNTKKGDFVSPAFYQDVDDQFAQDCVNELQTEMELGQDGSRLPALVLSAMIGSWKFHRSIVHYSDNHRLEHVHGTVRYSRPKLDYVLYREDGFYQLTPEKSLNVFREYEYLVTHDMLEIYFVESGQRAHLFLSLKFRPQTENDNRNVWVATSDHLCIKDLYKATFQVTLDGLGATEIVMTYRVKGPTKDYESTTILTPQHR